MLITEYYPQFFTATILEWKHLLTNDKYKDIILNSLRFLVNEKRILVYAFVIMPNHMHTIWQIQGGHEREDVQRDFLKFTAQNMKYDLKENDRDLLREFEVDAKDRQYQFWERNPLSVDIYSREVFLEKLNYIHGNPVQGKWNLCRYPEDYKYSTAKFYHAGIDDWGFVTHFAD
jgi:REP-associated tyrosine transposase